MVRQLIYVFFIYIRQLRTHQAMGLVQTANEGYWRYFGRFRVCFMSFANVLPAFIWEGRVFGFEIINFFQHATTFFSESVELGNSF